MVVAMSGPTRTREAPPSLSTIAKGVPRGDDQEGDGGEVQEVGVEVPERQSVLGRLRADPRQEARDRREAARRRIEPGVSADGPGSRTSGHHSRRVTPAGLVRRRGVPGEVVRSGGAFEFRPGLAERNRPSSNPPQPAPDTRSVPGLDWAKARVRRPRVRDGRSSRADRRDAGSRKLEVINDIGSWRDESRSPGMASATDDPFEVQDRPLRRFQTGDRGRYIRPDDAPRRRWLGASWTMASAVRRSIVIRPSL